MTDKKSKIAQSDSDLVGTVETLGEPPYELERSLHQLTRVLSVPDLTKRYREYFNFLGTSWLEFGFTADFGVVMERALTIETLVMTHPNTTLEELKEFNFFRRQLKDYVDDAIYLDQIAEYDDERERRRKAYEDRRK